MIRAPTASTPGAPLAADHATQYEALRQRALERVPPLTRHGLTVVLRQGLPAWMDAWSTVLTVSRRLVVRERLTQLLHHPRGRRTERGVEVHDVAPAVLDDEEAVEHAK